MGGTSSRKPDKLTERDFEQYELNEIEITGEYGKPFTNIIFDVCDKKSCYRNFQRMLQ